MGYKISGDVEGENIRLINTYAAERYDRFAVTPPRSLVKMSI